jgi:asparagine synthase (glutamine-hydrolysing)
MPGIVGIITRMPRERAERELAAMVSALLHESFYVSGTWVDETLGVYVGWVARKNSSAERMPLHNERGDVVLAFSGEEFSEPDRSERLNEAGHKFGSRASYLVHLYENNESFPSNLNGRFQGLLADRSDGIAILFNDRYGMERVYYHESKHAFYFAAEAKAIMAICPETRRMNPQAAGEFIACGCALEGRSLFDGIGVLPGGSKWVFRNAALARKEKYFDPVEWEQQDPLEPEPYYREIRDVFSRNLAGYFEGRESVGMSLTGGLDTRIIMAWQRFTPGLLPCYTFAGMLRDCQDVVVARRVAAICGQPHQTIPITTDFIARFPYYAARSVYLTEGCVDVGIAPDLYLNERAREIAPVRMTGLYGSEVLRGVRGFKPERPLPGLFSPELMRYAVQTDETYARLLKQHPLSFSVFGQLPLYYRGILALEQTQISVRTPFLDNDLVRTVYRATKSAVPMDVSSRLIADGNPELLRVRTDRGVGGAGNPVSKAVSRAFLEFLFKAEYGYDMGMPHWVARVDHALSPLRLERLFLGRHKIFHFRVWYRDVLSKYVRELLLDREALSRPWIQQKGLQTIVQAHLSGGRNYTNEIHKCLTLELVHRLFVDSQRLETSSMDTFRQSEFAGSMRN